MELTETQSKRIIANVKRVLAEEDISPLAKPAYHLITQYMGFIAHYDLGGFQNTYRDLREFCHALLTSEHSNNENYNLDWADELDRRYKADPTSRGCGQPPGVTDAIRGICAVARAYAPTITAHGDNAQRDAELRHAADLAAKYGMVLAAR